MALIWNETGVVENDRFASGEETPFIDLDAALTAAEEGANSLAVLVAPGDDVSRLAPVLDRVALVALDFPAFSDGRGFSHATLLRDRLGYEGEIRAVGDVQLDQVPFMLRVGITSVETRHEPTARRLTEMRLPGVGLHYQPSARRSQRPSETSYSWRRRTADAG
ncbi:DUF934 domain-containing protein [Pseudohoeflea coraliihabitans]|uniref:DUF934 domain-containing protein n=1 Tax=Pseudohoeflea coraliihabitans TaxID=2860393 RepID=A0ABS6WR18_9HYPH|nr:DUF934 domain-containing protein [Pseudohoeflea sp. DP4N28-3]MBW3098381.1 DUF934 domain-containing protein [Pseudohoeflea sp. DP4N28-3]